MHRLIFGTLAALGLGALGFALGGVLAAELLVSPGDGLAGGATVALSILAGAVAGLVAGILLAWRLAPATLRRTALLALLLGAASIGLVAWQAVQRQAARAAEARAVAPAVAPAVQPVPPPLPPPDTAGSLLGLVIVPAASLPRFETREHAYEEEAVTVYGVQDGWYLVGLRDGGREWLDARAAERYLPLEELVVNRLNWLTEAWDGRLRDTPDLQSPSSPAPRPEGRETPANVLEARRAGGTLWLRVEVLERSPCEGGTPPVVASGWTPAWGPDGKPTAWFYSRGC